MDSISSSSVIVLKRGVREEDDNEAEFEDEDERGHCSVVTVWVSCVLRFLLKITTLLEGLGVKTGRALPDPPTVRLVFDDDPTFFVRSDEVSA
jgi:hypothetical protein